jgi:flagellar hook protein FlgE
LANGATIGSANMLNWDLVGNTAMSITGYASTSVIKSLTNDGYASGLLKSLSVDQTGVVSGFFTNGQTSQIAQVCLADFDNPWGLKHMGNNLFGETLVSGPAIRNIPGASGMGDITSNSIEMSNVDIATEFINMISAQKAYQASARVITTTDQLMQELMNMRIS